MSYGLIWTIPERSSGTFPFYYILLGDISLKRECEVSSLIYLMVQKSFPLWTPIKGEGPSPSHTIKPNNGTVYRGVIVNYLDELDLQRGLCPWSSFRIQSVQPPLYLLCFFSHQTTRTFSYNSVDKLMVFPLKVLFQIVLLTSCVNIVF